MFITGQIVRDDNTKEELIFTREQLRAIVIFLYRCEMSSESCYKMMKKGCSRQAPRFNTIKRLYQHYDTIGVKKFEPSTERRVIQIRSKSPIVKVRRVGTAKQKPTRAPKPKTTTPTPSK